ncbi:non-homologous end-joining DNA ligase [Chelatococcus reniformis]|uniref:DNA ligase (ATP) n=1 Tax=Chelatococcus reniformis TaxID=1494448 RepID=A0A916UKW4_9HYPH|nr:ATP-dependent DNA ligase [Chelatococcus reniformis]
MKLDGYRLCCQAVDGAVTIWTRNGHDWTARFPGIVASLAKLPVHSAVIDGEAVVLDECGVPSFGALQVALGRGSWKAATDAILYAFDLLHLDGMDLRPWKLSERRDALFNIVPATLLHIRISEDIEGDPRRIFEAACEHGLEGIISKRQAAPYRSGRTGDWVKTKCISSDTFIVIGYEPASSGVGVGGLRLAERGDDGRLVSVGGVGTGFTRSVAASLGRKLDAIRQPKPAVPGLRSKTVVWVRPELLAEVEYRAKTNDGDLRHASFKGLRDPSDQ